MYSDTMRDMINDSDVFDGYVDRVMDLREWIAHGYAEARLTPCGMIFVCTPKTEALIKLDIDRANAMMGL